MANECPVCKKDDQIRKVSTIVASNQRNRQSTSSPVDIAGIGDDLVFGGETIARDKHSTSSLAIFLWPPIKPKAEKPIGNCFFVAGYHLIFLAACSLTMVTIGSEDDYFSLICFIFVSVIWTFVNAWGLRNKQRKYEQIISTELPIWKEKIVRWNRLYYCYRDDIVFDPDTNIHEPPLQIGNLLL